MNDSSHPHDQAQYQVRFDWGADGAAAIGHGVGVFLVVDVLSFSTAVDVATAAGLEVIPSAPADAADLATRFDATPADAWSDRQGPSPTALARFAASRSDSPPTRVVVPSPNGSQLSAALLEGSAPVVAVSLRNRRAVARWVLQQQQARGDRFPVAVIAAGERRADAAGIRFAIEDLLGAGAVIDALADLGIDYYSPEAAVASTAFLGSVNATRQLVTASSSGRELVESGFGGDVELAVQLDVSSTVPVSGEFGFRAAR